MKKKFLLTAITLFVFSVFVINVNAANVTVLQVPYTNETKALTDASKIPTKTTNVYATLTEPIDFSTVEFETATGGTVKGSDYLQKIVLFGGMDKLKLTEQGGKNIPNIMIPSNFGNYDNMFEDWFSAYCLDAVKSYPIKGLYNVDSGDGTPAPYLVNYQIIEAFKADPTNTDKQTAAVSAATKILNYMVSAAMANNSTYQEDLGTTGMVLGTNYSLPGGVDPLTFLGSFNDNPTGTFKVNLIKVGAKSIPESDAEFTVTPINAIFDKYSVTEVENTTYANALWILEHSYPSLSLQKTYELAGVDAEALKTEVGALSGVTDDTLDKVVEGYVYATIQYAIWKSVGSDVYGEGDSTVKLGSRITTENATELNKLYTYLTKDDHSGYGKESSISKKVTISGNTDKYTKVKDGYKFGPFTASYKAVEGGNISLSLDKSIDGVKITDADGNKISEVENGGKFYVVSSKTAKIGNIKVNATAEVNTYLPVETRARVYNPVYAYNQNLITGGIISTKNLDGSLDILVNAKTGVENVAVLLMVTLVAFSLGYLVLSYKTKPVELS